MAKIIRSGDFFKSKAPLAPQMEQQPEIIPAAPAEMEEILPAQAVKLEYHVSAQVRSAVCMLREMGMDPLAKFLEKARAQAEKERFTVAVAGEFSRGKSSFLNAFLGSEVLPVGNLPTTALLTRIRYHEKPVLIHADGKGGKQSRPLSPEAWDGLTADPMGENEADGTALVGLPYEFLQKTNIELMDTPGAGDLDAKRARVIGDALLAADGVIITISATAALSQSEKLFIEQRLIARKIPFLMLIITKLDQIPVKERCQVVEYVEKKLQAYGMDIPIFLPYAMEMPDARYQAIMGMDKVKAQLLSWIRDPRRIALTQRWLLARAEAALSDAMDALQAKKSLLDGEEAEIREKIRVKKQGLSHAEVVLDQVELEMLSRCNGCLDWLREKADECAERITERLEYEAAMTGSPQKWWQESYPYRMKIELTNMASAMEQGAAKLIANDGKWLNSVLEQQVKGHVQISKNGIDARDAFSDLTGSRDVKLSNIDKQRMFTRAGTTVLTIAGALLCTSLGGFTLAATMGIGTGSALVTEQVFKGKIEKQREEIKKAIRVNVPELVENALDHSGKRLKAIYDEMIAEAKAQQKAWLDTQYQALEAGMQPKNREAKQALLDQITVLEKQLSALKEE